MSDRVTHSLRAVALLIMAACEHNAWLGTQCLSPDVRCDDAAAHGGVPDAAASPDSPDAGSVPAMNDAGPPQVSDPPDTRAPALPDAAAPDAGTTTSDCRSVTMNFFACASANEMPGAPRLQAGRAYTLRFRSAYRVDTTFQLQGATTACTAIMLGSLTVPAGEPTVERCLTATEDIALLVTVMTGDVQVWMQNGLMAELCEGCS